MGPPGNGGRRLEAFRPAAKDRSGRPVGASDSRNRPPNQQDAAPPDRASRIQATLAAYRNADALIHAARRAQLRALAELAAARAGDAP